jgi:hypothetical protein
MWSQPNLKLSGGVRIILYNRIGCDASNSVAIAVVYLMPTDSALQHSMSRHWMGD